MRSLLAALVVMGCLAPHPAHALPPLVDPNATAKPVAGEGAFTLAIDAPGEIRDVLANNLDVLRYRSLTDLSDSELARLLLAAEQDARELVATLGYFSPTITVSPPLSASGLASTPLSRDLKLTVVPGEATRVSEVVITFTGPVQDDPASSAQRERIVAQWQLEKGMRFTQSDWADAKQQAVLQLASQKYPTAQITDSQADIDPETREARLSLTLDSGAHYRMGALVITGLNYYDETLVRRLARLEPQDYDPAKLSAAQRRLTDSGYFDSAFISIDTKGDPNAAPVKVQLREAKLQKLVLGVGASTDTGARISIEHTHHKIPFLDWRGVNKLVLARDNSSLASEIVSHPNDDNWRWSVGAVVQRQTLGSFSVYSQGLRVGRSRSSEELDNDYFLQYDRADSATSDPTVEPVVEAASANYGFTVRHFDHPLFPNSGWGFGAALGAGTTLGPKPNPYTRVLGRGLMYVPLGTPSNALGGSSPSGRLALRAQVGALVANVNASLPSTQLFFLGGDNSVRGYGYTDLGVQLPDGQITGGRYMGLGSIEWQRPIRINGRPSDWESTVFADVGSVANNASELRPKVGVGIGARWKSPVGPLQIDIAYGVDVQRLRLHLNVGFNF